MEKSQVWESVKNVVVDKMMIGENEVTPQTTWDDMYADSFDKVDVIMSLEKELGVSVSVERYNTIVDNKTTMGDICNLFYDLVSA